MTGDKNDEGICDVDEEIGIFDALEIRLFVAVVVVGNGGDATFKLEGMYDGTLMSILGDNVGVTCLVLKSKRKHKNFNLLILLRAVEDAELELELEFVGDSVVDTSFSSLSFTITGSSLEYNVNSISFVLLLQKYLLLLLFIDRFIC
jgi:hypothetical protein